MRRETKTAAQQRELQLFQSTPLIRGETGLEDEDNQYFYIFQSTPLMRGETLLLRIAVKSGLISIHSPHARGDSRLPDLRFACRHFNPLPSCEGRQDLPTPLPRVVVFQSTPLMRGETSGVLALIITHWISIHSPHARGDVAKALAQLFKSDFNPLPSCEGRHLYSDTDSIHIKDFNPLPSCEGRRGFPPCRVVRRDFNPLPSCEGRQGIRYTAL